MGRRSDHSRDELLGLALDVAEKVVAQEGIGALTARRISKEIGYSVGTIYNLFEMPFMPISGTCPRVRTWKRTSWR